jgi:hypothetical protein
MDLRLAEDQRGASNWLLPVQSHGTPIGSSRRDHPVDDRAAERRVRPGRPSLRCPHPDCYVFITKVFRWGYRCLDATAPAGRSWKARPARPPAAGGPGRRDRRGRGTWTRPGGRGYGGEARGTRWAPAIGTGEATPIRQRGQSGMFSFQVSRLRGPGHAGDAGGRPPCCVFGRVRPPHPGASI